MATDPYGNAWYDSYGSENSDKCSWVTPPSIYTRNNIRYVVQPEWDHQKNVCSSWI